MEQRFDTDEMIEQAMAELGDNANEWLVCAIARWLTRIFEDKCYSAIIYKADNMYFTKANDKSMLDDETIVYSFGGFVNSSANADIVELYKKIIKR